MAGDPGAATDGDEAAQTCAPAPAPVDPGPWRVRCLGRVWWRAGAAERVGWAAVALICIAVLALAARLEPDRRGLGTHEQLGLPPCGFPEMTGGIPCPSCGFTTTFALAAHGRPLEALVNQPFGFAVFVAAALMVPLGLLAAARGLSLLGETDRWPVGRIIGVVLALWLLAWLYKWRVVGV